MASLRSIYRSDHAERPELNTNFEYVRDGEGSDRSLLLTGVPRGSVDYVVHYDVPAEGPSSSPAGTAPHPPNTP